MALTNRITTACSVAKDTAAPPVSVTKRTRRRRMGSSCTLRETWLISPTWDLGANPSTWAWVKVRSYAV